MTKQDRASLQPGLDIDFAGLDPASFRPERLAQAHGVWRDRVRTEYQSAQVAARFLGEVLAAGESPELQRILIDVVRDELRHAELCGAMCRALGAAPPPLREVAAPLAALDEVPLGERVLASAISMFLVNEAFSVGYLGDLAQRCTHPVTRAVLVSVLDDESDHDTFGFDFVRARLALESPARCGEWRAFTTRLVRAHLARAENVLASIPEDRRTLAHWPDDELTDLGLASHTRLALLCQRTWREVLAPRLVDIGLADGTLET